MEVRSELEPKENAMKRRLFTAIASPLAAMALVLLPTAAQAERVHYGPNRAMIGSGIVTLGISYGASVIVGAQSDHPGDKSLFIPVAGPWMDLTTRGGCDAEPCGHETANKVLLVADGIVQAIGALDIVAGLFTPETVTTAKAPAAEPNVARMTWHVGPTVTSSAYGLAAVGTF